MSLVLKEWRAVVAALGAGATTLLIRKGGLAERRQGFVVPAEPFWLLPTDFHAQREKLTPAASPFLAAAAEGSTGAVRFSLWAEVAAHAFLTEWAQLAALAPHHLWTEDVVRERFTWAQPAGAHALVLRVWRAPEPVAAPPGADLGGCTSWLDLALPALPLAGSMPVLADAAFAALAPRLGP